MALIELKHVVGGYGGAPILNGVNIAIEKSDIGVIVGPNGAGKSTTLKAIFGLLKVTGGTIDAVGPSSFAVRFGASADAPRISNPSFVIQRRGSPGNRLAAYVDGLGGSAGLTVQGLVRQLAEMLGIPPIDIVLRSTGSGAARAVEVDLSFNPSPLTFTQKFDLGAKKEG